MNHRFDPTTLADDLAPVIDRLRPLSPTANNAADGPYSATFSDVVSLECAFVAGGQSDTEVRDDLRELLKRPCLAPLAATLVDLVSGEKAARAMNPRSALPFLYLPGAAGEAGLAACLSPLQVYWLRMLAYCVLVAYGPAGDALPGLPRSPTQEVLLEEKRHPRLALKRVPGDEAGDWFNGDEDEDASGVPVPVLTIRR